jgi:hypothetical protein
MDSRGALPTGVRPTKKFRHRYSESTQRSDNEEEEQFPSAIIITREEEEFKFSPLSNNNA